MRRRSDIALYCKYVLHVKNNMIVLDSRSNEVHCPLAQAKPLPHFWPALISGQAQK